MVVLGGIAVSYTRGTPVEGAGIGSEPAGFTTFTTCQHPNVISLDLGRIIPASGVRVSGFGFRVSGRGREREFFIDNLLGRIHLIMSQMFLVDRPHAMGV